MDLLLLPRRLEIRGVGDEEETAAAPFLSPACGSLDRHHQPVVTDTTAERAVSNLREAGLSAVLHVPTQASYEDRVGSYWSLASRLRPWAFVQPRSAEELSRAVKALVRTHGCCPFAVRSGGHMCWAGASNIEAGVTIDLELMTDVTYDPCTKIASIQAGARWSKVYTALEKHGRLVDGAREGFVGVGGFLTGGGITYFSCRNGFACDQVVNYEVVLADGRIVEANATANSDLFRVLKGGLNNFGIVTRFDMTTFEQIPIWDGKCIFPRSATDSLISAFIHFVEGITENPDGHIGIMWTYSPEIKDIFAMAPLTAFDGDPDSGCLREFMAIPGQKSMKRTTVAEELASFQLPSGKHDTWFTLTFKLDARILKRVAETLERLTEDIKVLVPEGEFTIIFIIQPLPASFAKYSAARGGNVLGLERVTDDSVIFLSMLKSETPQLAQMALPIYKSAVDDIETYAKSVDGTVDFRYTNYCHGSQDPLATYGEDNIRKMREASAKYDPFGIFQTRVPGGFKLPKAKK